MGAGLEWRDWQLGSGPHWLTGADDGRHWAPSWAQGHNRTWFLTLRAVWSSEASQRSLENVQLLPAPLAFVGGF